MTEIWFIRHGESTSNAGQPTTTPDGILLTPKGHEQAADVAARLPRAPALIVMSGYIRTQLTAAPAIERFPDAAREIWPIHEFAYLDSARYKDSTVRERAVPAAAYWAKADPDYRDGPNAESFNEFLVRLRDMVARIEKSTHDFIAVYAHGLVLHTLELMIFKPQLTPQEMMAELNHIRQHHHMPNAHVIEAANDNGKLRLKTPPHFPHKEKTSWPKPK